MITFEKFIRTLDNVAHYGEYYEQNPELKHKCQVLYPTIRELYKNLLEQGWLTDDENLEESNKRFSKGEGQNDGGNFKIKKMPNKKISKKVDLRTDFEEYDDERIDEAVSKAIRNVLKNM